MWVVAVPVIVALSALRRVALALELLRRQEVLARCGHGDTAQSKNEQTAPWRAVQHGAHCGGDEARVC